MKTEAGACVEETHLLEKVRREHKDISVLIERLCCSEVADGLEVNL